MALLTVQSLRLRSKPRLTASLAGVAARSALPAAEAPGPQTFGTGWSQDTAQHYDT